MQIKNAKGIKLHIKSKTVAFKNIFILKLLFNKNFFKNLYENVFWDFLISKKGNIKIFIRIYNIRKIKINM